MSSTVASVVRKPSLARLARYCFSTLPRSSSVAPSRVLAIPLVSDRTVSCRRSSRLFLSPYSPSRWSSSSSCSFLQGCLGVSNFFLGFLGSPSIAPPRSSLVSAVSCYFFSSFPLDAALAASKRTFFLTPTAFPLRPVVRVLWPLTFNPRECRIPFHVRMSFMKSMSAFWRRTRSGPTRCMSRPVSRSFRLLKSRAGTPCLAGSRMTSSIRVISASERAPVRASGFTCAAFTTAYEKEDPTPRIFPRP